MSEKNRLKDINIVFTGGHAATTAIAVVEEIKKQKLPWNLFFIGSKYAVEGKKVTTLEFRVLPEYGIRFIPLITGRLQRRFTFWTIPSLVKIPIGFIHSFIMLSRIHPEFVLSFGGFSAFPVVVTAHLLHIPVILHEQTAAAGRANQASVPFAEQITLSRNESLKYFPKDKSVLIGNPVSKKFFNVRPKIRFIGTPVIFITGGSRGSQNINNNILEILPELLKKYRVIHQTGQLDFEKFVNSKKILPSDLAGNYEIFGSIDPSKITDFYGIADLVISRAGANTVSEIMAVKRPAIVIPLPISYLDEQTKNAKILVDSGFGKMIPQKELTGEKLLITINEIFKNYKIYINKINRFISPDSVAAHKLVELLKKY